MADGVFYLRFPSLLASWSLSTLDSTLAISTLTKAASELCIDISVWDFGIGVSRRTSMRMELSQQPDLHSGRHQACNESGLSIKA